MEPLSKLMSQLTIEQQAHVFTAWQQIKDSANDAPSLAGYYEQAVLFLITQQAVKDVHYRALLKSQWGIGDSINK